MRRLYQSKVIEPDFMNATIHESALDFAVSLLIEAGFQYSFSDIDQVLHLSDDSDIVQETLKQREASLSEKDIS